MPHCGILGNQRFSDDVDDIRGTTVRGSEGEKLGDVDDVIFDHNTMEIRYIVVDSGGWLESGRFLVPADEIFTDRENTKDFTVNASKQEIKTLPRYDERSLNSEEEWKRYEERYKEMWHASPVQHRHGSDRNITPDEEPGNTAANRSASNDVEIPASQLFPDRLADVFSDPTPSGSKVTLRPSGTVARAERAASGVSLLKPRWDTFVEHLRRMRQKMASKCPRCASEAEKGRSAA